MTADKLIWAIVKIVVLTLLTLVISIFGIFIFIPISSLLIITSNSSSFFGFADLTPLFIGFLLSFSFCFSLSVTLFTSKLKNYLLLIILIINLASFFLLYNGSKDMYSLENLYYVILLIASMLIGWLIGEGILRLKKMMKK